MTKKKDRYVSKKLVDFKCPECGAVTEELVTDGEIVFCYSDKHPESVKMVRQLSSPGMVKGNVSKPGFKERK